MVILVESKADEQRLIDFAGEDLAKRFFSMKSRLKSPENDIYYWLKRSPEELEDRLNKLEITKTRSQKDSEASEGAELIYNKNGWKVYHITTYEASAKYGKNTQWCISGSKRWSNGERGEEYFNDYTSKGIKFYFYIKGNDEKYALALGTNGNYQVFNQVDDEVDGEEVLPNVPGLPSFEVSEVVVYTGQELSNPETKAKKIIIDDSVTSIKELAFFGCSNLQSVTIPDNVTEIRDNAFGNCISIQSIVVPNSVTKIGTGAFSGCVSLKEIRLSDSIPEISNSLFENCRSLESLVIPAGVVKIGSYSFNACRSLKSVDIPDSVHQIETGAFNRCESLRSIKLPSGLPYLDDGVFYKCISLESVVVPDSVTWSGVQVFEKCSSLKSVKLSNNMPEITEYMFSECISLESIVIPESVESIKSYAFEECSSLKSITIPDSVTEMGDFAFSGCGSVVFHCKNDSYAQHYAEEHGIPYEII